MIKIFANLNKQDVVYSYSLGQPFPEILGKLLRVEINGNELLKLSIPLNSVDNVHCIWHGRNAGKILKRLREI